MTPIPNTCISLLIPTMESTLLSLGRVRKESKLLRSYKSRGEGFPHFMLAVLHIHTGMWILYLTRNIIQLHITFWQIWSTPSGENVLGTDCLVKHCMDTLPPDMQLQFDIWVLHWWMSKPQMSCFMGHNEVISWKVRVGSTGGKPAIDVGLYH